MAKVLEVYLNDVLVGRLEQDDSGSLGFAYDQTWLALPSAVPLSASLPLKSGLFGRNECRPFFAGLLPEEESRNLIAKSFGVSDKNDFALLERIGAECAGAVSLLPQREAPTAAHPRYREISREELAGKFASLPFHPLLAGEDGVRLSLAGAQGKFAVSIREGRFYLPQNGAPSSHILKPKSPHFDGLVENEFFCMRLAAKTGLEVASVEMGKAGDTSFLQVERFDRKRLPDGRWQRIHQEDFCQALGIPPELKYQQEGGPNLKKCFALVRSVSTIPGPDVLRLFDAVVFNYLIGNSDAHGKNFSFLYDGRTARLSPLYDLVCTQAYPQLPADLAMKIGEERKPSQIHARNWQKFFKEVRFGNAAAQQRVYSLAERVVNEIQDMAEERLVTPSEVIDVIRANCQRVLSERWKPE